MKFTKAASESTDCVVEHRIKMNSLAMRVMSILLAFFCGLFYCKARSASHLPKLFAAELSRNADRKRQKHPYKERLFKPRGNSMFTLSWGNLVAIVLPGAVTLLGLRQVSPTIEALLKNPGGLSLSGGVFLLMAAAVAGGILEGIRRLLIDELLVRRKMHFRRPVDKPNGTFYYLTPENLVLFDAAIENSYRYYTFYCNLSLSILLLVVMRVHSHSLQGLDAILLITMLLMIGSAYVQYGYFVQFTRDFVENEKRRRESEDKVHA